MKIIAIDKDNNDTIINHTWRLSVDQAVGKYFPGATIDSGDSPWHLIIYKGDDLAGEIVFDGKKGEQELSVYLTSKYGANRAKAIIADDLRQHNHDESFYR